MSSSWPIVIGMIAVVIAAVWYDAAVATASPASEMPRAVSGATQR